jgi:hypothetical protein
MILAIVSREQRQMRYATIEVHAGKTLAYAPVTLDLKVAMRVQQLVNMETVATIQYP